MGNRFACITKGGLLYDLGSLGVVKFKSRHGFDTDQLFVVVGEDGFTFPANVNDLEPMTITPEWLLKLGFELVAQEDRPFFNLKFMKKPHPQMSNFIVWASSGSPEVSMRFKSTEIRYKEYLHEVQAAYALETGFQLTLK